jgi:hypothetical protein
MKRLNLVLSVSILSILLSTISCNKDGSSDPCSGTTINITATIVNSDATNGSITATATGGSGFTYSIDNTTFQASGVFSGLAPASYNITAKNSTGCSATKAFTVAATKTYYITRNTWKFSSATVGGSDVSAFLQACQKDNILTFAAAGTGNLDEGATKCNAGDPQNTAFTWSFQSGETQLFVSAPLFTGGSSTFTLVSISATQMVVSQVITVGGSPQTAVVTFIH